MRRAGPAALALTVLAFTAACTSPSPTSPPSSSSASLLASETPTSARYAFTGTPEGRAAIVQFRPVVGIPAPSEPSCGGSDPCSSGQLEGAESIALLSRDGETTYELGPVFLSGADLVEIDVTRPASAASSQGWELFFSLNAAGSAALRRATTAAVGASPPANKIAVVIDGRVATAPSVQSPITQGKAVITSGYTRSEAETLAQRIATAGS